MTKSKKILIGVTILFIALCIISMNMSQKVVSTTTREMKVPSDYFTSLLTDFNAYRTWYPKVIKGTKSQLMWSPGSKSAGYTSESYTSGLLKIQSITSDTILVIDSSNYLTNYKFCIKPKGENVSIVSLTSERTTGFFSNLVNIFYKWKLSKMSSRILDGLESESSQRANEKKYYDYTIQEVGMEAKSIIYLRSKVKKELLSAFYSQNLATLYQKAQAAGIITTGSPFVMYQTDPLIGTEVDMMVALQTISPKYAEGLESLTIESKNAAKLIYYGPRENNHLPQLALSTYLADRKLKLIYPILEEYVTDPSQEPDPYKWETHLYYYFDQNK